MRLDCDCLVLGGGVAGLTFALEAAKTGRVVVITKGGVADSATNWAQGGIAAVLDPTDSFEAHVADTLGTGGGLSHHDVVEMVVRDGPERVRELAARGAEFTETDAGGALDLTREGGHSARRVVHAGDVTGQEVQRALSAATRAHPNIELREGHMAIDLLETSRFGGP